MVPNNPNFRSNLCPMPAVHLAGSCSGVLMTYCLMQHVKALFFTTGLACAFLWVFQSLSNLVLAVIYGLSSVRAGSFDGFVDCIFRSISSSLSRSGWSPAFRGDDSEGSELKDEGWGDFMLFRFCCCSKSDSAADFCSSRSPHSLKSCSRRSLSASLSLRRL